MSERVKNVDIDRYKKMRWEARTEQAYKLTEEIAEVNKIIEHSGRACYIRHPKSGMVVRIVNVDWLTRMVVVDEGEPFSIYGETQDGVMVWKEVRRVVGISAMAEIMGSTRIGEYVETKEVRKEESVERRRKE